MSGWDDKLDDYMFEEEMDGDPFAFGTFDDDEEDLRIYFFGSEENFERFNARLDKAAEGTHIINPKKMQQLKTVINLTKVCLDGSYTIEVRDPDVKFDCLGVTFKSKNLTIRDPQLLTRIFAKDGVTCDFCPHLNGEVSFGITVHDAFIKIGD